MYRVLIRIAPYVFMFLTPPHLFALLILGLLLSVFLLFLPALVELKKPQDGGPRLIEENMPDFLFRPPELIGILNVEEEQKLDNVFVKPLTKIIGFLPDLED